jgi:hypothetical protein
MVVSLEFLISASIWLFFWGILRYTIPPNGSTVVLSVF